MATPTPAILSAPPHSVLGPPPPAPARRTRASSTPPPNTLTQQSKSDGTTASKSTSCTPTLPQEDGGVNFLFPSEAQGNKDEDVTPTANPVVPPRPFMPPRPYPPNKKKTHHPSTRPVSAPSNHKIGSSADPPIPARPKKSPARPNRKSPKHTAKVRQPPRSHDRSHDRPHDRPHEVKGERSPPIGSHPTSPVELEVGVAEVAEAVSTSPTFPITPPPRSPPGGSGGENPSSPPHSPPGGNVGEDDETPRHPSFSITRPDEVPGRDAISGSPASPSSPTPSNGADVAAETPSGGRPALLTLQSSDHEDENEDVVSVSPFSLVAKMP